MPTLKLYRRHHRVAGKCAGNRKPDSRSYESEESRRDWGKKCACPIYASGTLGGKFDRKNTGCFRWEEAKQVAASWEAAQSWGAPITQPVSAAEPSVPAPPDPGVTIHDATQAYLLSRRNREIAAPTYNKYRTLVKQLHKYAESQGYVYLAQLTVTDMDRFYASWNDGPKSRSKKLERLKGFVKFCLKRKWFTDDIAEDIEPPSGVSGGANKSPFSDAEMQRIFDACDGLGGPTAPGPGYREWSGQDVKDFIMLSIYTGLRISDAATFDVEKRLKGNEVFLRMHKTRKELYTWVPDWLRDVLLRRAAIHGPLVFALGESRRVETMAELWRVKLKRVFELAGSFEENPTPHRFRHTFVRMLLERGVPVSDVADLIGDTEDTVLRHYARWVPERQERLTSILREKLSGAPRPALVVVGGRQAKAR